jgi:hypothetical protein
MADRRMEPVSGGRGEGRATLRARAGRPRGALVALALLVTLAALAGCERKVTLATDGADTTATIASDSLEALFTEVRRVWEAGADDDAAARLTAEALYAELARHSPEAHRERAESLLDSLGVGAEITGERCGLFVNLFVRSDPTRGSWPFLYWCQPSGLRMQAVEGKGMKLVASASLADPAGKGPTPGRFAALFSRTRNGRSEPILFNWGLGPKNEWSVVQTLGPDSLGGYGTGAFESEGGVVDLVTLTYRPLPRFDECATCPHAFTTHRFRWEPTGFTRLGSVPKPSPYGTFVRFVDALTNGREDDATQHVAALTVLEQARALEWDRPKGTWRVAPGTDETEGGDLKIFRGTQETYQVAFESRGPDWVISGIELAPRTVE